MKTKKPRGFFPLVPTLLGEERTGGEGVGTGRRLRPPTGLDPTWSWTPTVDQNRRGCSDCPHTLPRSLLNPRRGSRGCLVDTLELF